MKERFATRTSRMGNCLPGRGAASLDGAILRVDPDTGQAVLGNPFYSSSDPNPSRRRLWDA